MTFKPLPSSCSCDAHRRANFASGELVLGNLKAPKTLGRRIASFRLPLPHGAHDPGGRHHERVQALPLATPLSATLRTRRWLLAHENNKEDQIKEDLK